MKTLKDYLFEGFFNTDTDAVPIDCIYKWLKNNIKIFPDAHLTQNYTVIKNDTIFFDFQKSSIKHYLIIFKTKAPEFIKFDKDNWLNNAINADFIDNITLNTQEEINKYPFIGNAIISTKDFEISVFTGNVYIPTITGTNQKLNNLIINFYKNKKTSKNVRNEVNLINFKIDDINCIKVNSDEPCNINIEFNKFENYIKDFCEEIYQDDKYTTYDADIKLLRKYKDLFNWMDNNNIYKLLLIGDLSGKNLSYEIYNYGHNKKSYNVH